MKALSILAAFLIYCLVVAIGWHYFVRAFDLRVVVRAFRR